MKLSKDWTYRTTTTLVEYKAGDVVHDFALDDAKAAGVLEEKDEPATGSAPRNTLKIKV